MTPFHWDENENRAPLECVRWQEVDLRPGDRVRLWPRRNADIMDMALKGKAAVIEAIEQDYENQIHLAVVVDDDPGRDMGLKRQIAHRFFFSLDEVEPLTEDSPNGTTMNADRVLIVGIGNIFMGDDAFGCEVAQRLLQRTWPEQVRVADFGIRAFDVAYALMDGYGLNILIDAMPRGEPPGTVYLIEPDLNELGGVAESGMALEGHSMDPVKVLRMVKSLGGEVSKLLIVGCEPAEFGSFEEGKMGLSAPLAAAIDQAVTMVDRLIDEFFSNKTLALTGEA